ncbi:MAG: PAS domain-containing sensor histidine kinase [Aquiluna sp.]|nr:PAS domain-containing sensor histidine kinase [Aquiluna sp.]MCF8546284.1 PAS domain-containing sensor histidine kinase [Aquiluna sp.]
MVDQIELESSWLRALQADWQLIADLAFSDLVLWVPEGGRLSAYAHARPAAAATLFYRDISGPVSRYDWAEVLQRAFDSGEVTAQPELAEYEGTNTRVAAYPVFPGGKKSGSRPIAVISRHTNLGESRMPTKFQINFMAAANELLEMVSTGEFPIPEAGTASKRGAPRPSDGLIRLDADGRVIFASPNALSMLNRAEVLGELEGRVLAEAVTTSGSGLQQADEALPLVLTGKGAWRCDLELGSTTLALRSIPVKHMGERTGAILLCREVSDLRVRERELITKDLTIREIHHRVKNNLQTVASLLRLQARQSDSEEVKESLSQAMRRVSAIAVVHDVLSEGIEQEISFDQIFKRILALIPDIAGYHTTVKTEFSGTFGELPTARATPLALVLTEVVANAVEHGLGDRSGKIAVEASRDKKNLHIEVTDDGSGLAEGKVGSGLGTQIIKTLVESELRGKISWTSPIRGGTRVAIDLPI